MPVRLIAILPNALSTLRLVLAALFVFLPDPWRAGAVALGALTDFTDGWIARRFGVSSWAGGLLDAVADKAFVLVVLATLTLEGDFAWWQAVVLLSRDLTVASIAAYAAILRHWVAFKRMPSRTLGKAATAGILGLFLVVLVLGDHPLSTAAFLAAATLSLAAALDYLVVFIRAETRRRAERNSPT